MDPIWVNTARDIEHIRFEVRRVAESIQRYRKSLEDPHTGGDDHAQWERKTAIASAIESAYSGFEKIFERIAERIDGSIPEGSHWHADLLYLMGSENPSVRPPILDKTTLDGLDQLRRFRHRERNLYSPEMDADLVIDNGRKLVDLTEQVVEELTELARLHEGKEFQFPLQDSPGGVGPGAASD